MKKLPVTILLAVGVIGGIRIASAEPSDSDVIAYAQKVFAGKMVTCESKTYVLTARDTLTELHKVGFQVSREALTEADRLNGLDFEGRVRLAARAYRLFNSKSAKWEEGQDQNSVFSTVGVILDVASSAGGHSQQAPTTPGELASDLRHKNGEWSTEATNIDTLSNLDCAKVASIQAGRPEPDSGGTSSDSSAMTSSQAIQETPWGTRPATPAPAAPPAVDPSRRSMSHAPTQIFYPVAPVPVFVHGHQGPVLCTVPAGTPVPSRMDTHPQQFRGDYGVLAYKADLCPNTAGNEPRDLYHEVFFRARPAR